MRRGTAGGARGGASAVALRPMPPRAGAEGRAEQYLHPGQLACCEAPTRLVTILGSCVAVCLFDPARRIGGMNHFLLPQGGQALRYGNVAIEQLLSEILALGATPRSLRAKVFGGANVIGHHPAEGGLGAQNVAIARVLLERERIPIVAEDLLGTRGRKLVFTTDDGAAWVRKL